VVITGWGVYDDPAKFRTTAERFRQLAKLLTDPTAAVELLEIAAKWESRALEIETERREQKRS
jgi:hypothetical protein